MCEWCGCGQDEHDGKHDVKKIELNQSLMAENDRIARGNKRHIEALGAVGINLISSPGAGKTTLLEATINQLKKRFKIGVIEGDIETERDADRIRRKGVPVVQLTTGGACHLDANIVHKGLHHLEEHTDGTGLDIVFIENVGNLVCPASFYLGEHKRVVLVSVPEGSDKPAKYPKAFISSDLFVVTKTDLLDYFDFSLDEAKSEALRLNPSLELMYLSSTTGNGMDKWISYLTDMVENNRAMSGKDAV